MVNSAGNERNDSYWPHLVAPSDGDSVLAVAALAENHYYASFSSPGPSADGRIKPDCSAMGLSTVLVNTGDTVGIITGSGTSFSCPLIAGLCALTKQAAPALFGYNLALAVRTSGDRVRAYDPSFHADSANNDYGWGIPKGPVAAGLFEGFYGRIFYYLDESPIKTDSVILDYGDMVHVVKSDTFGIFVDPLAENGDTLTLTVPGYKPIDSLVVDGDGRALPLRSLHHGYVGWLYDSLTGLPIDSNYVRLDYSSRSCSLLTDSTGGFVDLLADSGEVFSLTVGGYLPVTNLVVHGVGDTLYLFRYWDGAELQLFPNPASDHISCVVYSKSEARISIWSSDGVLVHDFNWKPGAKFRTDWDLTNNSGEPVANGVYIVRLATEEDSIVRKIAVVR